MDQKINSNDAVLDHAAHYAAGFRRKNHPIHPSADASQLRRLFDIGLPEKGRSGPEVIDDLIAAAEPGLVGNTHPNFMAWVMGSSHPTGVAADWLTSVWGQNAAIYQTAPAAAIAEEVSAKWLLDLLDLPDQSSVGFTTGATMAGFICLAAARGEVLCRAGWDFDESGLQGAPLIRVFVSDEAHMSNFAAFRFLGLGEKNLIRIPTDDQGILDAAMLAEAMITHDGPKIILCQAGHINSGAFDPFTEIADLANRHNAWMHVDGAFGLWARAVPEMHSLCAGVERADSWSVDGHKWLQIPYDSGFAIVRDAEAHRRAMDISASYLNHAPGDGRNPTQYNPELSRRARGFAVWSVLQALGREGVSEIVRRHHQCALAVAAQLHGIEGIEIHNDIRLNQIVMSFHTDAGTRHYKDRTEDLAIALNATGQFFVRTAEWKGRRILRISIIANDTGPSVAQNLSDTIRSAWKDLQADCNRQIT